MDSNKILFYNKILYLNIFTRFINGYPISYTYSWLLYDIKNKTIVIITICETKCVNNLKFDSWYSDPKKFYRIFYYFFPKNIDHFWKYLHINAYVN